MASIRHKFQIDDIVENSKNKQGETWERTVKQAEVDDVVSIITNMYKLRHVKEAIIGIDGLHSCQKQKPKKTYINNTHSD